MDVTHAFDGVTLHRLKQTDHGPTYNPTVLPVVTGGAYTDMHAVTFGGFDHSDYFRCLTEGGSLNCGLYSVLEVTFDAGTNFVAITGDFNVDVGWDPILYAYDSAGNEIGRCGPYANVNVSPACALTFTPLDQGKYNEFTHVASTTLALTLDRPDIARVVWGGFTAGAYAHQISYATVPEPSTLLLLGMGAVGVVRRRKQFHTSLKS